MAPGITYHVMTPETADEVAALVTDVFLNDEPMLKALNVAPGPYLPYARFYCAQYALTGLSLVARDPAGTLAGFILCHDLTFDIFKALEKDNLSIEKDTYELLRIDSALLEELDSSIGSAETIRPGDYLHFVQLGTASPFRGMGLATGLVSEAIKFGVEQGFRWAVSECSSDASRRSHEKCGFSAVHHIAYSTYELNGTKPFGALPGGCTLMVRELIE